LTVTLYSRFGKRVLDLVLALTTMIVLAPLTGVVAAAVRLALGSPVIFRQERAGLHDRPFDIIKFRSMTDTRDGAGDLLPPTQRATRFGNLLRSASLDELPQLINVLRGQMSLVGPRPLHVRYSASYAVGERRRFEVRPGITGWAQVNGRVGLSWDEALAMDAWYAEHLSLSLDLRILFRTVGLVFSRSGVNADPARWRPPLDEERASPLNPQAARTTLSRTDKSL